MPKKRFVRKIKATHWENTLGGCHVVSRFGFDFCISACLDVERAATYLRVFRTTERIDWVGHTECD
jgi:hypothetical protein